jgi:hypothetical protein
MYSGKNWADYLPCISSYDAAKRKHDDIKPIRGRADKVRPLGKRSADYINIHEVGTSINPAYAVRLYLTDIVTYHADGRIVVRTGGWASSATTKALHRVLPTYDVARVNKQVRVCGYVVPPTSEGLTFVPADGKVEGVPAWDGYTLIDPHREYTHVINRKAANEVRKQFKHFNDWYKGYMSLREGRMLEKEIFEATAGRDQTVCMLPVSSYNSVRGAAYHASDMHGVRTDLLNMMQSGDYAQYQKAAAWLQRIRYTAVYNESGNRNWHGRRSENNVWECNNAWEKWQDLLLLLHAPYVMDVKPLPYGKSVKDKYAAWMRGWISKIPNSRFPTVLPTVD